MNAAPALQMRNVCVDRGQTRILEGLDLDIQPGEFVCLLGPSGCGKTTLLDLAAGLIKAEVGQIECMGQPVEGLNAKVGYLFQSDALLPWSTALTNVSLPLRLKGLSARVADKQAQAWLERVGLGKCGHYYRSQLSGGMRKRVALAQLLIQDAAVLLMDEPFAALDALTRQQMHGLLLTLWEQQRKAVLFVTHDLDEAITLSDRIVVLSAGPNARCLHVLPVTLPRPRSMMTMRTHPTYLQMHQSLWGLLQGVAQPAEVEQLG
ncbi:ABC transporter ATP-binding protein [Pseudomonas sp. NPDC089752]|uniref:ABC transporter ATP-binding protein n=1 Tax=Pseudomonas sp. NPDC089752 TaxID=3364472 RepID=UPI00380C3D61